MASQSVLEILIQAVDQSARAFSDAVTNLNDTGEAAKQLNEQLNQIGQGMKQAGDALAPLAASLDAFYAGAIASAAATQEANDKLSVTIENVVNKANEATGANGSYATQVSFLQAKIDSYRATIAEATATLDTHTGSVQKTQAAHEKAAATIATAQDNVAKYQAQLDLLTNSEGLVGASSDDLTAQFEKLARANTNWGFSIDDSDNALGSLFATTQNTQDAINAYFTAMDLARAKGLDLATASEYIVRAFQGQGKAVQDLGVNLKDGLSGMAALSAIQEVVQGQAEAYSDTLEGQMKSAFEDVNKLFSDLGTSQLSILQKVFDEITKLLTVMDAWIVAHPKLTEAVLILVGVLGGLSTVISGGLVVVGALAASIGAIGTAFGISAGAVLLAGGIILASITGLGVIVTLIVLFHSQIGSAITTSWGATTNFLAKTWQDIAATWQTAWNAIKAFFSAWWTELYDAVVVEIDLVVGVIVATLNAFDPQWRKQWQAIHDFLVTTFNAMKNFVDVYWNAFVADIDAMLAIVSTNWNATWSGISNFFIGIWDGVKSALNSALSFIQQQIATFASWVNSVFGPIVNTITAVGNVASGFGKAVSGAFNGAISLGASVTNIHDAIITPGGDVIQSDPADFLIATKTPGSLVGAGGGGPSITVNIMGGYYLDSSAATQIGNELAKQIVQQIRVRNYRS
jgi:hypothetical protein